MEVRSPRHLFCWEVLDIDAIGGYNFQAVGAEVSRWKTRWTSLLIKVEITTQPLFSLATSQTFVDLGRMQKNNNVTSF